MLRRRPPRRASAVGDEVKFAIARPRRAAAFCCSKYGRQCSLRAANHRTSSSDAAHTVVVNIARCSVTLVPAFCAHCNYDKDAVLGIVAPLSLSSEPDPLFRPLRNGATFLLLSRCPVPAPPGGDGESATASSAGRGASRSVPRVRTMCTRSIHLSRCTVRTAS